MNALHQIHRALQPAGLVIDTQPISARPPVESRSGPLGTLDMREWARTIAAIDDQIEDTLRDGRFQLRDVRHFVVTDEYDDGSGTDRGDARMGGDAVRRGLRSARRP